MCAPVCACKHMSWCVSSASSTPLSPSSSLYPNLDQTLRVSGFLALTLQLCSFTRYTGERSSMYLTSPQTSYRVRQNYQQMKFIVLLRNQVDRIYADYLYAKCMNSVHTAISFERWWNTTADRNSYKYYTHLQSWMRKYDKDSFLVLEYDEWISKTRQYLHLVQTFLGMQPIVHFSDKDIEAAEQYLQDYYPCSHAERLQTTVDSSASTISHAPPLPDRLRASIREVYEEDNKKLVDLLGPLFAY